MAMAKEAAPQIGAVEEAEKANKTVVAAEIETVEGEAVEIAKTWMVPG